MNGSQHRQPIMMTEPDITACTPLDAALTLARLGLRVLPITPGKKHPPIPGWQDAATTNPDTITSWWTDLYRGHGVGIATGPGSKVWVLDLDVANGKKGRESLEALFVIHGRLPSTVAAITGTGGGHWYFRWDPQRPITNGMATQLPEGLDIRGQGGQVVAPPTIHPAGGTYTWAPGRAPWEIDVADAPDWLYELLRPPEPEPPTPVTPPVPRLSDPDGDSPAELVRRTHNWHHELGRDGWTEMHTRGGDTYWCRPGKHPRDGHSAVLHEPDGPLVIFTTDVPPGLAHVGRATSDGSGRSVTLFDYVAAYRYHGDRAALARDIRRDMSRIESTTPKAPATVLTTGKETTGEPDEDPEAEDPNRHRRRLLTESELASIQPPEPLAQGWFNRNSFAVLFGPAKKGKTFVAIDLSMSIATGRGEWMCGPAESGQVVYCLGEGISGLNRRIQAWRTHHGVTDPARLAVLPHVPQLHNGVDVADFIEAVDGYCPDLIVIDTLARATVGVEENSSKDMGEVIHQLDRIKEATGACVLVLHHTGKDASRGTRGSSALTGAIDTGVEVRGDTIAMTLVVTQQKDGDMAEPCQFRSEAVGESIVMVPTLDLSRASSSTIAVMEALVEIDTGGTSTTVWKDMAAERGVPERTFFRAVKWLVDNREVVNVGSRKRPIYTAYTLPDEGDD